MAVAITGSCAHSLSQWEAPLIRFVWYLKQDSSGWPLRVIAFVVVLGVGWMHLFFLTDGLRH
jgi:hypothetical protein